MLVNPVVSSGTRLDNREVGDNPSGADDQQERLITMGWVLGFVDGEGCFSIGLVRQPGSSSRRGYRLGWQVVHRFVVVQGARSLAALEQLRHFLGVGRLHLNRRHDNHREHLVQYVVDRRHDLLDTVIPFFEDNPLRTDKRQDFDKFARIVRLVDAGHHLQREGLIEIATITEEMNSRKSRAHLIRILRGHTPDIPIVG